MRATRAIPPCPASSKAALLAVIAIAVAPASAARVLLGDSSHSDVIMAGALIAFLSVLGGVQEGVLQGLESFVGLSVIRLVSSVTGLTLLLVLAKPGNLASVIAALATAAVLRAGLLIVLKEIAVGRLGLYAPFRTVWQARGVVFTFSLPSVLVSLISGFVGWYGLFALKGLPDGFQEIAFVTAGQQWRGTVLFGTTILASVAVPMMSRLNGAGDNRGVRRLHMLNAVANLGAALIVVFAVICASNLILGVYGSAFIGARLVFAILMTTTLPAVYIIVLQNYFVSHGRMWEQLSYSAGQSAPLLAAYWYVVPRYGATGFAAATFVVTLLTAAVMHVLVARDMVSGQRRSVGVA